MLVKNETISFGLFQQGGFPLSFVARKSQQNEGLNFIFSSRLNDSNYEDTRMDESEKQVAARFVSLKKAFADPLAEVYIEFSIFSLPLFISYNLFIQHSDILAHLVFPMTKDSIQKISKRFLKFDVV